MCVLISQGNCFWSAQCCWCHNNAWGYLIRWCKEGISLVETATASDHTPLSHVCLLYHRRAADDSMGNQSHCCPIPSHCNQTHNDRQSCCRAKCAPLEQRVLVTQYRGITLNVARLITTFSRMVLSLPIISSWIITGEVEICGQRPAPCFETHGCRSHLRTFEHVTNGMITQLSPISTSFSM